METYSPLGPPPKSGDWVVNDNTIINDTKIVIKGNLEITNSGNLELINVTLVMDGNIIVRGEFILRNVTLIMNLTFFNNRTDGDLGIIVESSGRMYILDYDSNPSTDDGSLITSVTNDGRHAYSFWVKTGAEFKMENSVFQECGFDYFYPGYKESYIYGLYIETNNVEIRNCTINYTENGIIFNSSNSNHNLIINSTFARGEDDQYDYGLHGLSFIESSNNKIEGCTFQNILYNILLYNSHNNTISDINIIDSVQQVSDLRYSFGIYSWYSNDNSIYNISQEMIYKGIELYHCVRTLIKDYTINGTFFGLSIEYGCAFVDLIDIEISNTQNYDYEPNKQFAAGIFLYYTNININLINVSLDGINNDYCYGIWWDTPEESKEFKLYNCSVQNFDIAIEVTPFFGGYITGSISDVIISDSFFEGNLYGFRIIHEIKNWEILNSTIKKSSGAVYTGFELGVLGFFNSVKDISINDCRLITNDSSNKVNGIFLVNYYGSMLYDIDIKNTTISNMSNNGISIIRHETTISGNLYLDNTTITNNTKDGIYSNEVRLDLRVNNSNISANKLYGLNFNSLALSNIEIENSTIQSNLDTGISIHNSFEIELTLENSSVNENRMNGLLIRNSDCNVAIQYTDFIGNYRDGLNIVENFISIVNSNISENLHSGLIIKSCTGLIQHNKFRKNAYEGILLNGSNNNIKITDNELTSNGFASSSSEICIIDSSGDIFSNVFNNLIDSPTNIALVVANSNDIRIIGNTFCGRHIESVIDISNSEVLLENNNLKDCGPIARGIYGHDSSSLVLANNSLMANGKYGILVSNVKYVELTGNRISDWIYGIYFSNISAQSTQVKNNIIERNSYCGIYIKPNTIVNLENNDLFKNLNGIIIEGTSYLIQNNICYSNATGVWVINKGYVSLIDNNIIGNTKGVLVENGKCLSNNNLIQNNDYGYSLIDVTSSIFFEDKLIENDLAIEAVGSKFGLYRYLFQGNNQTMSLVNSECNIFNSSITALYSNFKLNQKSYCLILNTQTNNISVEIFDSGSKLEKQWFLNITVVNSDNQPLSGVTVELRDRLGNLAFTGETSILGKISNLNVSTMSWSSNGQFDPNPYRIMISKKDYGSTQVFINFTKNMNVTLTAYKLSELITSLTAVDVPNDQGGAIMLTWSSIPILNFGHFNIYVDNEYISSAGHLKAINSSIIDQNINSIIITKINNQPLLNGQEYYFAVTIVDSDGNEDWRRIKASNQVKALDNLAPAPVKNLTAFDTPNDNGGSITVTWEQSTEMDFNYYALYSTTQDSIKERAINILDLPVKTKITYSTTTSMIITDLNFDTDYYFFILVYDINGNVNQSFEVEGPVRALDNIPPRINKDEITPKINETLIFKNNEKQLFSVLLSTVEEVSYFWYLDDVLLENTTESFKLLSMSELELGYHNLTLVVFEPSGLNDTVTWNFFVESVPIIPTGNGDEPEESYIWVILIIVIFIIVILASFSIRFTYRYNTARRTIKTIPTMADNEAVSIIKQKMEENDKYTLIKLTEELPRIMDTSPDKLFFILSLLTQNDSPEIRESAAKNIAALLDNNPHNAFTWLRRLQYNNVRPDIYLMISKTVNDQIVKELYQSYYSIITSPDDEGFRLSLEHACAVLKSAEGIKFGLELSMMYSTLNEFLKSRTIAKLSTSKPTLEKLLALRNWATEFLYPEAFEVYSKMATVAESLGKYEKVEGVEDKLSYLSISLNLLEDASRIVRERLLKPERDIFTLVLNSWRNIISVSIRDLRGRADLGLNLVGKEFLAERDKITLMLEIENKGRSIAERVLVELVPSNDYVVLTPPQELGGIGYKKKKEVTFELRPRATDAFRVEFTVHYDDAEKKEKAISFGDLVSFMKFSDEFKEIPNPYIVGTPIKTGSKLFVGRRDLIDFIHKNIRGSLQENIIILIGHRRTGKTTLLKQLPLYLDKSYVPIYIDIQGIIDPGMDAFFYLLATEIVTAMQERGYDIKTPKFESFKERPSFHFEYEFLKEVYNTLGDSILILMFDEFEELEVKVDSGLLDKNIFSYLRHLMQHTKQLAFIFTGSFKLEDLKTDYWSIMFNIAIYKRVSFLSELETKELITEPVKEYNMIYDPLALEKIYRLTHGHPYFTQLLCHALVNLHNSEKKNYIKIQEVDQELNRILERGQMHFDFIWDRSSRLERLVMTTLSRVLESEETATISSIVNKIAEYNLNVSPKDISKTLDLLSNKDIIAKILNHTTKYEFKVDLIRIWLINTKQLDQVVENYRVSN